MAGQPTFTRANLRKKIARKMKNEFFKYQDSGTIDGAVGGTPVDAALYPNGADYWNEAWMYGPTNGTPQLRRIVDHLAGGTLIPHAAFNPALAAADTYELFDLFSPLEIHDAINDAIEEGYPSFFGLTLDETIVLLEDTLEYSLANMTQTPHRIYKIWMEYNTNVQRGVASSATSTTLTVPDSIDLTNINTNYKISIYDGTGAGQILNYVSKTGQQLTGLTWTTTPDSTSKFAIWDPTDQRVRWYLIDAVQFDAMEFPTKIFFPNLPTSNYGFRLRIQHSYRPGDLSLDSSTTPVPDGFIVPYAMYLLYQSGIDNHRVDRQRYAGLADRLLDRALKYKANRAFTPPTMTLWQWDDANIGSYKVDNIGDPLGFSGG